MTEIQARQGEHDDPGESARRFTGHLEPVPGLTEDLEAADLELLHAPGSPAVQEAQKRFTEVRAAGYDSKAVMAARIALGAALEGDVVAHRGQQRAREEEAWLTEADKYLLSAPGHKAVPIAQSQLRDALADGDPGKIREARELLYHAIEVEVDEPAPELPPAPTISAQENAEKYRFSTSNPYLHRMPIGSDNQYAKQQAAYNEHYKAELAKQKAQHPETRDFATSPEADEIRSQQAAAHEVKAREDYEAVEAKVQAEVDARAREVHHEDPGLADSQPPGVLKPAAPYLYDERSWDKLPGSKHRIAPIPNRNIEDSSRPLAGPARPAGHAPRPDETPAQPHGGHEDRRRPPVRVENQWAEPAPDRRGGAIPGTRYKMAPLPVQEFMPSAADQAQAQRQFDQTFPELRRPQPADQQADSAPASHRKRGRLHAAVDRVIQKIDPTHPSRREDREDPNQQIADPLPRRKLVDRLRGRH